MGNQQTDVQKRNATLARYGVASGALTGVALITTQANALDVAGATATSTAGADVETGALWVLGIAIVIFSARKVIGFFR
jgi:hypothetical protein